MQPVLRVWNEQNPDAELRSRSDTVRFKELDSLRGIAALTVVLYHIRLVVRQEDPPLALIPVFAGNQAVNLFFVLSGFVISLPYWAGKTTSYPIYALRRIVRIYLPFLAAALLSIAGAWTFRHYSPHLSSWFSLTWHTAITPKLILAQLLMWPMPVFNTAFWSLRYEMQMSFLMPAMVWVLQRVSAFWAATTCLILAFWSPSYMAGMDGHRHIGATLQTASLFVLGAALAKHHRVLAHRLARTRARYVLLALSLFVYFDYPGLLVQGTAHIFLEQRQNLVSSLGAAGLILCVLSFPQLRNVLHAPILEYGGEISYSLYLTHSIVIFACFDLLNGKLSLPLIVLSVLVITLALAHLFFVLIERPCIELTRRLKTSAKHNLLRA